MEIIVIASHPKIGKMQLRATVNTNNAKPEDPWGDALTWQIGDVHGTAYSEIDCREKIAAALTTQGWTDITVNL